MAKLVSGRVKRTPQSGITSDRYEFLGLEQAEPDLGDPLVGPSSVVAKPFPPGVQYVLANVGGKTGERYWIRSSELIPPGLAPGSFTVFNNDIQVGIANSFNRFNFVGNGVSVDPVGPGFEDQTGIATVRIQIIDAIAPGNEYEIPYHDPITGFLRGATGVVYKNSNIGIGSTNPTQKLDVLGNLNVSGQVGANTITVGLVSAINLNVGTSSTTIKTLNGNVGIGTTIPNYNLDIFGSSRFYGLIYDYTGSPGTPGDTLISRGNEPPTWGVVGDDIPVRKSATVSTTEADNNQLYYIGFSSTTDDFSALYVDSNGLYYNPSSVSLGIGTQPQYALDVNGTIRADSIISQSILEAPGIVTTTSTNEIVIDTFNTLQTRSARYNLQVTTNNQLQLGTASISSINYGQNYLPGTYNNTKLISSGIGTGAEADVIVTTGSYPITQSFNGVFTTSANISAIVSGEIVILDKSISPSDYEQSKLTSIQISNPGAGFTAIPSIVIDAPIIVGNPVSGVGIGSTAIVTDVSMKVTNVILNTSGIVTNTVPTATFDTPIGVGETAEGYVGFGISSFTITGVGTAYSSSPTVVYDQTPTSIPVTRVGLGISDSGIQITGGSGYGDGTTITVDPPPSGGTQAEIILASTDGPPGAITGINIVNVGSGYTVPPPVTVTGGGGVGAAITITQMIVTNIDVDDPGSGFGTSKPIIQLIGGGGSGATAVVNDILLTSIEVTNSGYGYTSIDMPVEVTITTPGVGSTVGLGIYEIAATTGLGYTTNPSFVIDSPGISPFTEATLISSLGYDSTYNLLPGPGYGGTTAYYIDPIDSSTFRLTKDISLTDYITLGFNTSTNPTAYIGGAKVDSITIVNGGSGYEVGEILTIDTSVMESLYEGFDGDGFSFTVASPLIQSFQISDVIMLQSVGSASTEATLVEYAGIANLESLGEYDADIDNNNARLKFTPIYAHNTIKFTKTTTEL